MTRGRIGWNVVTGYGKSAAKAMGDEDAMPREERYLAADEYMSLVYLSV
jgi:alkanesulfonate monooxygenase SsuD/methylene tetrahydromethanopterin reductase-like flavin-dependent oxidoreductase (luciferase family)